MKNYYKLRKKVMEALNSRLPEELYYHDINHTLDVLKNCNKYIKREKIDKYNAKLLRIGALLHDIGFTVSNINHEETGRDIAGDLMKSYGFPAKDIAMVEGLIIATRIPQSPKNELEKIICDCDLDYLGRSDFYTISDHLYRELEFNAMVHTKLDWDKIQIKFLEAHTYHTEFALKNRQPQKEKRIAELKKQVANSSL